MVFNGFIGKKCKVENFLDMNGSQSPTNVVCTPTCGVKEHDPPACGVRLLHFNSFELILFGSSMVFNGFECIYRQKMQSRKFPRYEWLRIELANFDMLCISGLRPALCLAKLRTTELFRSETCFFKRGLKAISKQQASKQATSKIF